MSARSSRLAAVARSAADSIGGTSRRQGPLASSSRGDVLGGPGAVDEPLEQAVRGQPVGPVQARAGDLAGRPEAGQRRPAVVVDVTPPIM